MTLAELDHRLQYGPGLRVQRLVEAGFLIAAFLWSDVRFAWVTLALTSLQALSPRLSLVAALVTFVRPAPGPPRLSDLYFDLDGSRGACAMSALVQATALWLVELGHTSLGFLLLTVPTASFVLSPTIGFCAGCAVYVGLREAGAKLGLVRRCVDGACDVEVDESTGTR